MQDQTSNTAQRAQLREAMPTCAVFVADLLEVFGRGQVRVLYAAENGHSWGDPRALEPDAVIAQP